MEEVSRPQPQRFQRTSNKERTRNGNDAKSSDTRRGQLPLRRNSVGDHSGTTAYNGLPLRWLSKNDGQCVFLKRSHSDAGISRDERRACNWWIARDGATLFLSLCLSWLFTKPAGIDVFVNVRRSEEHTSELHSLMRISYDVFCLKKKT